jgi:hypothetical protein
MNDRMIKHAWLAFDKFIIWCIEQFSALLTEQRHQMHYLQ